MTTSRILSLVCLLLSSYSLAIPTFVRQTGAWSSCQGVSGVCIDTLAYSCSTATLTGRCPGSSAIRCCPSPGGVNTGSCFTEGIGKCTRTELCPRTTISGKCPGPAGITCCPSAPVTTLPPVTTAPPSGSFLPPSPDITGNLGVCTTPFNALSGHCIDRAKCTGGTFNGLCPGGSNILCCVAETRPTSAVPASPQVSLTVFRQLFTNISPTRAAALHPYFLASLAVADITTCLRVSAFSAQVGHESAGLLYFEEISDGSQYEGRTDLGNTQPGDGRRFKGRGPMQLTGRFNYRSAGTALGRSFESRPEEVGMPSGGFEAAAWYWGARVNNADADLGTTTGFDRITVAINGCGGNIANCNGVDDRRARWAAARSLLGC